MSDFPHRVVLTRHPQQAGDLEAGLRGAGYEVAFMPLTQQVLPEDQSELRQAISDLRRGEFSWMVVTSGNTVRALVWCGWNGAVPAHTRVGAVGPGTASVLEELTGIRDIWMPHQHSAAGILAELPRPAPGENPRLLLPQSAQARTELVTGLRALGWDPTQVIAYRTTGLGPETPAPPSARCHLPGRAAADTAGGAVLTPSDLKADDAVLVTSSTAAEQWSAHHVVPEVRLLAIGRPTAETLKRQGTPADQVLSAPTAAAVLACLNVR
ncbi:uroporphyrinogen-III synthase [Nesterenkonia muleiensis]|uniref:uroporphyrinogen-III synthase n=1 Tax=Nesterenkonia muleiensis TaxID=2282648 RepID=UPI000E732A32|nr:uroporphyrinogen-III synthase [Nesterenkonia muleiensis]